MDYAAFVEELRDALNHLCDPELLLTSPLVALFGLADRRDAFSEAQRILTDAIGALQPPPDEPPDSPSWRIYECLYYRYVEQSSAKEVAGQLALGERQLRRVQRAGIAVLAERLWSQYGDRAAGPAGETDAEPLDEDGAADLDAPVLPPDLAWLRSAEVTGPTDVHATVDEALALVRPLAERNRVSLEWSAHGEPPEHGALPGVSAHPLAFSQALLGLLAVAVRRAAGGVVSVAAEPHTGQVAVRVVAAPAPASPPRSNALSEQDKAELELARQLMELSAGRLTVQADGAALEMTLLLPAFRHWPILAIDDNEDVLRLMQRYSSGTRYRLVGTRDPEQAIAWATKLAPRALILDVMMPGVDGWKLLGRLRQHPTTERIPIIICTILPQEELARSLGAAGFLRKPIKRVDLLAELDRVAAA